MAWTHAVNRWRVNDLDLRHRMILDGLVWGTMPGHHVADDLRQGRLVMLPLDPSDPANQMLPELTYSAAHPVPKPLGLAGRWLVSRLVTGGVPTASGASSTVSAHAASEAAPVRTAGWPERDRALRVPCGRVRRFRVR